MRTMALCHPDRPQHTRGLCGSCYAREYRKARPEWTKEVQNRWHRRHPEQTKERWRKFYTAKTAANPDWNRARNLKSIYKLEPGEYEKILARQDGMCAICKGTPGNRKLHVDHDHESGDLRGLLCAGCNGALGAFQDNPVLLEAALSYLESSGALIVHPVEGVTNA